MVRIVSRQAVLAGMVVACVSLFGSGLGSGVGSEAAAGPFGDEAARAVAREQQALVAAPDSLGAVADSVRPMARAEEFTVASREEAPEGLYPRSTGGKLSFAALDAMPPATGDEQWQCLAEAIYFESRGEPIAGQIAVAEVVLNRAASRSFPETICGVTNQGVGNGRACQFSYACDGRSDVMTSAVPRERSEKLARLMIDGHPRTVTGGATYFHTRSIRPSWSRQFTRTTTVGHHMFYRPATKVTGS